MTHIEEVVRIVSDPGLQGLAKRGKVFEYLFEQPDRGLAAGIECLLETDEFRIAEYVGQYLEVMPGAAAEKERAAVRLRQEPQLVRAAARLVPWLSEDSLNGFVADYVNDPERQSPGAAGAAVQRDLQHRCLLAGCTAAFREPDRPCERSAGNAGRRARRGRRFSRAAMALRRRLGHVG
jgi:hypothetical protein